MDKRGSEVGEEKKKETVEQLRHDLTPEVFDATFKSIKKEIEDPDFDPKTSPLLESYRGEGGGESLLLLIGELIGLSKEFIDYLEK